MVTTAEKELSIGEMVGDSAALRKVRELIVTIAANDAPVLVTGESGTGKELVVRALHRLSNRSEKPFVPVNCAAIPSDLMESELFGHERGAFTGAVQRQPGCFERAHGGTLFLDEITEMSTAVQPKLLRVIEDGRLRRLGGEQELEFDVRILAATNRSPASAIEDGSLREDLYFRLNIFTVELPPLRARKEDIQDLALHFIRKANKRHGTMVEGISSEGLAALHLSDWPGNIRELRNVIERAVIISKDGLIEQAVLPRPSKPLHGNGREEIILAAGMSLADAEREILLKTLKKTSNNKSRTARLLGIDVKTVRSKMRTYGL